MKLLNFDFWTTASDARDELEEQLQDYDDVRFVDIGYPQNGYGDADDISLRIHVDEDVAGASHSSFPPEIDGIPVTVSKKG